MATKSLIVVNKVVLSDQEEDVMLDVPGEVVFLREVLEDDYVEGGTKERDNHLFWPKHWCYEETRAIASRKNYFSSVAYTTFLFCEVSAMVNLSVWYALSIGIDRMIYNVILKSDEKHGESMLLL